jgi:hypothetical protein
VKSREPTKKELLSIGRIKSDPGSRGTKRKTDDLEELEKLEEDDDEDEMKYESGEEGKGEGHWEVPGGREREGKKVKL